MKWILISSPSSRVHVFNLMEGSTIKEVLRYNPLQQSARIDCMGRKRLFFIEQPGFRSHHFTFKNEYGFYIGRLSVDDLRADGGTIEIEEKKFIYRLITDPVPELVIYEYDHTLPLVTCSFIKSTSGEDAVSGKNRKAIYEYASLLLGLCWYLFNPPVTEKNTEPVPVLSFA